MSRTCSIYIKSNSTIAWRVGGKGSIQIFSWKQSVSNLAIIWPTVFPSLWTKLQVKLWKHKHISNKHSYKLWMGAIPLCCISMAIITVMESPSRWTWSILNLRANSRQKHVTVSSAVSTFHIAVKGVQNETGPVVLTGTGWDRT